MISKNKKIICISIVIIVIIIVILLNVEGTSSNEQNLDNEQPTCPEGTILQTEILSLLKERKMDYSIDTICKPIICENDEKLMGSLCEKICPENSDFISDKCYKECPSPYINKGTTCRLPVDDPGYISSNIECSAGVLEDGICLRPCTTITNSQGNCLPIEGNYETKLPTYHSTISRDSPPNEYSALDIYTTPQTTHWCDEGNGKYLGVSFINGKFDFNCYTCPDGYVLNKDKLKCSKCPETYTLYDGKCEARLINQPRILRVCPDGYFMYNSKCHPNCDNNCNRQIVDS